MKRHTSKIIHVVLACMCLVIYTTGTVYAVPETPTGNEYLDDFVNGVSSAIDDIRDNLNNAISPTDSYSEPTDYIDVPIEPPTDYYGDGGIDNNNGYGDDDYNNNDYNEPEDTTEVSTEEPTFLIDEPEENENYGYSYTPPEEDNEEEYEPEILTETYTDPPFLERLSFEDAGEGNLFVALGVWTSIIVGIIIVMAVTIATHKIKKG